MTRILIASLLASVLSLLVHNQGYAEYQYEVEGFADEVIGGQPDPIAKCNADADKAYQQCIIAADGQPTEQKRSEARTNCDIQRRGEKELVCDCMQPDGTPKNTNKCASPGNPSCARWYAWCQIQESEKLDCNSKREPFRSQCNSAVNDFCAVQRPGCKNKLDREVREDLESASSPVI